MVYVLYLFFFKNIEMLDIDIIKNKKNAVAIN